MFCMANVLWTWANHFTLLALLTRTIFGTLLREICYNLHADTMCWGCLFTHLNEAKWLWWFSDGSGNNNLHFDNGDTLERRYAKSGYYYYFYSLHRYNNRYSDNKHQYTVVVHDLLVKKKLTGYKVYSFPRGV